MDTQLVLQAQGGDRRAFEMLAGASIARLHGVAYGILRDHHLAEEATQQAIVDIWRDLPRLRDPDRFEAWSYRLVVNSCRDAARRQRRSIAVGAIGVEPMTDDEYRGVQDRDRIERGLRRLSVDHRAVVVLSYYLDLSPATVAATLGVSVGTVHSRLHRAMRALRAAIDADDRSTHPEPGTPEVAR
jgi:RNA polymerase sigma-70 factor (ECF subfamily)